MTNSKKLKYAVRRLIREPLTPHQKIYFDALKQAKQGSSHSSKSHLERAFDSHAAGLEIGGLAVNFKFHPTRGWELDRAHTETKVAAEIQGGIYGRPVTCPNCHEPVKRLTKDGRFVSVREGMGHSTGAGLERDFAKFNAAQVLGWMVILVSPRMAEDGSGALLFKQAIESRKRLSA